MSKDYFRYTGEATRHTSFPLGGIGAGSIGLGADGRLKDWEIFNRPAKGTVNGFSHFAIRAMQGDTLVDLRILNGPFMGNASGEITGSQFNTFGFGPARESMAGFPCFEETSLTGPYPVADLNFTDHRFPGAVQMKAFSPFVPMESRISSMPAAFFEFEIENTSSETLEYSIFGCIGFPFKEVDVTVDQSNGARILGTSGTGGEDVEYGEICLSTDHTDTSCQRNLFRGSWFDTMEVYWQDLSAAGLLKDRFYEGDRSIIKNRPLANYEHSVLASHFKPVAPGERKSVRYVISWFVPYMKKYWNSQQSLIEENKSVPEIWSNYYAREWAGARAVADEALSVWDDALEKTNGFREILSTTTAPLAVIDAVASNLSIIKTATALRLEDGTFYGWEGCHPSEGCCEGSCTHVWNYQQVLPFLFPDLERSMREADFQYNQITDSGGMTFRLTLPIGAGIGSSRPCVDGQFGNVLKAYRDWKLTGDLKWLAKIWPSVKAAIEYSWHSENYDLWDPEKTGVITGRQHHTLDMELFGPNGWLNGFYLAALVAGAEMAEAMGDASAATEFRDIFEKGRSWTNENLFNGEYFIQKVDLSDKEQLEQYTSTAGQTGHFDASASEVYWNSEHEELKYQIMDGCEIDQVLAQWHTNLYGLPTVFDEDKFVSAVQAIYRHNYKPRLGDTANPCRIFGMGEESGTVMCSWPDGTQRPKIPVPYSQETMHGFEYAFGTQLMMVGELEKGFDVFKAVRDRYRGHNRNPWNEIECGSNYARSMSSFAALLVLSGFKFDGTQQTMSFCPVVSDGEAFNSLWSNGLAWGSVTISEANATICVKGGELSLSSLKICNEVFDVIALRKAGASVGSTQTATVKSGEKIRLSAENITLPKNQIN
jgi:uncharacterized protein (DUF608 family)